MILQGLLRLVGVIVHVPAKEVSLLLTYLELPECTVNAPWACCRYLFGSSVNLEPPASSLHTPKTHRDFARHDPAEPTFLASVGLASAKHSFTLLAMEERGSGPPPGGGGDLPGSPPRNLPPLPPSNITLQPLRLPTPHESTPTLGMTHASYGTPFENGTPSIPDLGHFEIGESTLNAPSSLNIDSPSLSNITSTKPAERFWSTVRKNAAERRVTEHLANTSRTVVVYAARKQTDLQPTRVSARIAAKQAQQAQPPQQAQVQPPHQAQPPASAPPRRKQPTKKATTTKAPTRQPAKNVRKPIGQEPTRAVKTPAEPRQERLAARNAKREAEEAALAAKLAFGKKKKATRAKKSTSVAHVELDTDAEGETAHDTAQDHTQQDASEANVDAAVSDAAAGSSSQPQATTPAPPPAAKRSRARKAAPAQPVKRNPPRAGRPSRSKIQSYIRGRQVKEDELADDEEVAHDSVDDFEEEEADTQQTSAKSGADGEVQVTNAPIAGDFDERLEDEETSQRPEEDAVEGASDTPVDNNVDQREKELPETTLDDHVEEQSEASPSSRNAQDNTQPALANNIEELSGPEVNNVRKRKSDAMSTVGIGHPILKPASLRRSYSVPPRSPPPIRGSRSSSPEDGHAAKRQRLDAYDSTEQRVAESDIVATGDQSQEAPQNPFQPSTSMEDVTNRDGKGAEVLTKSQSEGAADPSNGRTNAAALDADIARPEVSHREPSRNPAAPPTSKHDTHNQDGEQAEFPVQSLPEGTPDTSNQESTRNASIREIDRMVVDSDIARPETPALESPGIQAPPSTLVEESVNQDSQETELQGPTHSQDATDISVQEPVETTLQSQSEDTPSTPRLSTWQKFLTEAMRETQAETATADDEEALSKPKATNKRSRKASTHNLTKDFPASSDSPVRPRKKARFADTVQTSRIRPDRRSLIKGPAEPLQRPQDPPQNDEELMDDFNRDNLRHDYRNRNEERDVYIDPVPPAPRPRPRLPPYLPRQQWPKVPETLDLTPGIVEPVLLPWQVEEHIRRRRLEDPDSMGHPPVTTPSSPPPKKAKKSKQPEATASSVAAQAALPPTQLGSTQGGVRRRSSSVSGVLDYRPFISHQPGSSHGQIHGELLGIPQGETLGLLQGQTQGEPHGSFATPTGATTTTGGDSARDTAVSSREGARKNDTSKPDTTKPASPAAPANTPGGGSAQGVAGSSRKRSRDHETSKGKDAVKPRTKKRRTKSPPPKKSRAQPRPPQRNQEEFFTLLLRSFRNISAYSQQPAVVANVRRTLANRKMILQGREDGARAEARYWRLMYETNGTYQPGPLDYHPDRTMPSDTWPAPFVIPPYETMFPLPRPGTMRYDQPADEQGVQHQTLDKCTADAEVPRASDNVSDGEAEEDDAEEEEDAEEEDGVEEEDDAEEKDEAEGEDDADEEDDGEDEDDVEEKDKAEESDESRSRDTNSDGDDLFGDGAEDASIEYSFQYLSGGVEDSIDVPEGGSIADSFTGNMDGSVKATVDDSNVEMGDTSSQGRETTSAAAPTPQTEEEKTDLEDATEEEADAEESDESRSRDGDSDGEDFFGDDAEDASIEYSFQYISGGIKGSIDVPEGNSVVDNEIMESTEENYRTAINDSNVEMGGSSSQGEQTTSAATPTPQTEESKTETSLTNATEEEAEAEESDEDDSPPAKSHDAKPRYSLRDLPNGESDSYDDSPVKLVIEDGFVRFAPDDQSSSDSPESSPSPPPVPMAARYKEYLRTHPQTPTRRVQTEQERMKAQLLLESFPRTTKMPNSHDAEAQEYHTPQKHDDTDEDADSDSESESERDEVDDGAEDADVSSSASTSSSEDSDGEDMDNDDGQAVIAHVQKRSQDHVVEAQNKKRRLLSPRSMPAGTQAPPAFEPAAEGDEHRAEVERRFRIAMWDVRQYRPRQQPPRHLLTGLPRHSTYSKSLHFPRAGTPRPGRPYPLARSHNLSGDERGSTQFFKQRNNLLMKRAEQKKLADPQDLTPPGTPEAAAEHRDKVEEIKNYDWGYCDESSSDDSDEDQSGDESSENESGEEDSGEEESDEEGSSESGSDDEEMKEAADEGKSDDEDVEMSDDTDSEDSDTDTETFEDTSGSRDLEDEL
ncbi:uncharacterized protein BDZ99DRAFT_543324 [Mytilinidion resinicola]|uniref:Uncharacterized protein n=1 Tax=Mytilinidion resinicola TaxID=574789 RepID=A0A6A6Z7E6_9PEZI|nr:uncharacterized protein BDZ99DRAFT_543324 [Mytilinidion resinicola]KAF2816639.1 hypothetical protein BDZ99DRAFT_543324 [Mytilinidion resinicola]